MRNRKTVSLFAMVSMVMMISVMAEAASGQPWPEAHSGAYLGVQVMAVTSERASALKLQSSAGAVIAYVDQDGPACHAGLMENDVVVAFNGAKVDGPEQLQNMIHVSPPQKTVTLTIIRNGQRKDVKVTLGSWNVMSNARAFDAANLGYPPPPRAYPPEIEIPSFTLLSARHGLVVESLSPQLADFFGVARGHGVLVRSVEGGSPAAAAGIKAGDVILKVNNEDVHDMSDWQRGMHTPGPKLSVVIWREKKEQSFTMYVPGAGDRSRLSPGGMLNFDTDAQLQENLRQLAPELAGMQSEIAQLEPSQEDMEQMRQQIRDSMKDLTPQMREQMEQLKKEMEQQNLDLQQMMQDMQWEQF